MLGLGAAALFLLRNRGASEENQAPQLAGAAMMAAGEGTAPDAPFQQYSAPANPIFFFNQGGEMAQIPETNVPRGASSDEDIGTYPGGSSQPELEFTVERSTPTPSTTDISPINPVFSGSDNVNVIPSTVWDAQAQIAKANFMPLLAVTEGNGNLLGLSGSDADISNLSSKEQFRAINVSGDEPFTTTAVVLSEYVQGFTQDADLGRTTSNLRDQFGNIGGSNQFDPAAAANAIVISQTSSIFEDTHVARWDYSE